MRLVDELELARAEFEDLLVETLGSMLDPDTVGHAPVGSGPDLPALCSTLAIHDMQDDSYTFVEVRVGVDIGRRIAEQMFGEPDPAGEDLLDVIAELGNILAGNVKALVRHSCQLSLPSARVLDAAGDEPEGSVRVGASVLGHLVELTVYPVSSSRVDRGIRWPGATKDQLLEAPR